MKNFALSTFAILLSLLAVAVLPTIYGQAIQAQDAPASSNLALYKPIVSSSDELAELGPNNAVDGNEGSRWGSQWRAITGIDTQWLTIDLGTPENIGRVKLNWETAYGKSYQVQTSNDGTNWTTIYSTNTSDGWTDDITGLSGRGRYIRVYMTQRGTEWGYSLFEVEVYSTSTAVTPTTALTGAPTAGPTAIPTSVPTATPTPKPTATPTSVPGTTPITTNSSNLALKKPSKASSVWEWNLGYDVAKAFDGDATTRWNSQSGTQFNNNQWISVDLGANTTYDRVVLKESYPRVTSFRIQSSQDDVNYTDIPGGLGTTIGDNKTIDFSPVVSRYVRLYMNTASNIPTINEMEVYAIARVCTPRPANMIGWWRGEGNAYDSISTNHGFMQSGVYTGPGKVGQGFIFPGGNDDQAITFPQAPTIYDISTELTLEAWVNPSTLNPATGRPASIISKGTYPHTGLRNYGLYMLQGGGLLLTSIDYNGTKTYNPITAIATPTGTSVLSVGKWSHVAGTIKWGPGGYMQIYVDGVLKVSQAISTRPNTDTTPITIGNEVGKYPFPSRLDEVGVYNRALSASEIQRIYNAQEAGKCL